MRILTLLMFVLLPLGSVFAFQAGGNEENPFTVLYDEGPIPVRPGQIYPFQVTFRMPEHFYLYQDKIKVNLDPDLLIVPGPLKTPPAIQKKDPFFGRIVPIYYDEVTIELPLQISKELWKGDEILSGEIQFQGCGSELCYKLMHIPLKLSFVTEEEGVIVPPKAEIPSKGFFSGIIDLIHGNDFDQIRKRGFGLALLLSFLGGFLTDFTPCVWPMIPVTLAVIGVRKDRSIKENLGAAFFLVLGMAVMYSVLGILAAFIGRGLGFLFQNLFFLILLEVFFAAMALSLLGLFDIQLPHSWQTKLAQISSTGRGGIFMMGLSMGLIAAPCVGPVVGPLLAYVAKTQDLFAGFVLLLSYAFGMGILFLILGGAYGVLKIKIRSGGWMVWLKRGLGIVMILFAVQYGKVIYAQIPWGGSAQTESFWVNSIPEGLGKGATLHKPVLIDFFAKWCPPCKELDRTVFSDPRVMEKLRGDWVAVRVDCTTETPECREAVDRFHVVGWPTLIFLDEKQNELESNRQVGKVISVDEMLKILGE